MAHYRLSAPARQDLLDILERTEAVFGTAARERYEALLFTALADIAADPVRPGSRPRPELGERIRTYALRHSRERARLPSGVVRTPRHVVLYRSSAPDVIGIGRILHDSMA